MKRPIDFERQRAAAAKREAAERSARATEVPPQPVEQSPKPEAAKPLTPNFSPMHIGLPKDWSKPFRVILEAAPDNPAVALFPGVFLAACNGSKVALKRVLESAALIYWASQEPDAKLTRKELAVSRSILWLTNALAEKVLAEDAKNTAAEKPVEAAPITAPETPAEVTTNA